jgi:hypothetical protein
MNISWLPDVKAPHRSRPRRWCPKGVPRRRRGSNRERESSPHARKLLDKTTLVSLPFFSGADHIRRQVYRVDTHGREYWEGQGFPGYVTVAIGTIADPNFPGPTISVQTSLGHSSARYATQAHAKAG